MEKLNYLEIEKLALLVAESTVNKLDELNRSSSQSGGEVSYGEVKAGIDRLVMQFDGFWKILVGVVAAKFGKEKAEKLRKKVLSYLTYPQIRRLGGGLLRFSVSDPVDYILKQR
jgi:hypothetical protein